MELNPLWIYLNLCVAWISSPFVSAAAAAKLPHSCPTLCDPLDGSPPSSPIPGILQARILEWVAISFSNAWKWKVKVKSLSRVRFLATPWTAAYQALPSMGFSRQEYWSGVPLPSLTICVRDSQISIVLLYLYLHEPTMPSSSSKSIAFWGWLQKVRSLQVAWL